MWGNVEQKIESRGSKPSSNCGRNRRLLRNWSSSHTLKRFVTWGTTADVDTHHYSPTDETSIHHLSPSPITTKAYRTQNNAVRSWQMNMKRYWYALQSHLNYSRFLIPSTNDLKKFASAREQQQPMMICVFYFNHFLWFNAAFYSHTYSFDKWNISISCSPLAELCAQLST